MTTSPRRAQVVPTDRPRQMLAVRELDSPKPPTETLETPVDLDDRTVLLQINDRAPQHRYP